MHEDDTLRKLEDDVDDDVYDDGENGDETECDTSFDHDQSSDYDTAQTVKQKAAPFFQYQILLPPQRIPRKPPLRTTRWTMLIFWKKKTKKQPIVARLVVQTPLLLQLRPPTRTVLTWLTQRQN